MSTGVYYTSGQINTMQSAIGQAEQALSEGNPAGVISALNTYYAVQVYEPGTQTVMRGYASLALQVLNNTGNGAVANQEVENAVGQANYTPQLQAQLALKLAESDFADIGGSGNQVPDLALVATYHQSVYGALDIPITAWGGTPFTALGQDFTNGYATPAELSSIEPTRLQTYRPTT